MKCPHPRAPLPWNGRGEIDRQFAARGRFRAPGRCSRHPIRQSFVRDALYSLVAVSNLSPLALALLLAAACTPAKAPLGVCVRPPAPPPAAGVLLSPDEIRTTVIANLRCIRACYEPRALEDPSLRGTVRVAFTIERDGSVSSSKAIEVTIHDDEIVACVLKAVANATFPTSSEETNVTFPFVFRHAARRAAARSSRSSESVAKRSKCCSSTGPGCAFSTSASTRGRSVCPTWRTTRRAWRSRSARARIASNCSSGGSTTRSRMDLRSVRGLERAFSEELRVSPVA